MLSCFKPKNLDDLDATKLQVSKNCQLCLRETLLVKKPIIKKKIKSTTRKKFFFT
jgi:hypothetical protein